MRRPNRLLWILLLIPVSLVGCAELSLTCGLVHGSLMYGDSPSAIGTSMVFYALVNGSEASNWVVTKPVSQLAVAATVGAGELEVLVTGPDGQTILRQTATGRTGWTIRGEFIAGSYAVFVTSTSARYGRVRVTMQ